MIDVLVAGAGPTGLALAHELARRGLTVRLIDAAPGPATTSRALATHARTLELYDQMGVLDAMLARGRRVRHFSMYQRGRRLVRFGPDYSELPTRFPFTLVIDQVRTEEVLREAADGLGVRAEWGVRVESVGQDDAGSVRAGLRHTDGSAEEVEVPWLVGCDGGHSTVRGELGLPLIGEGSETWLISDAKIDLDLPGDSLHLMHVPGGSVMAVPFPERDKWRLLDTVDAVDDGPDAVAARFARKIAAGCGQRVRVAEPTWVSVFTIQQRMVPRMRVGRCMVAGDAAHVHSPASGQGLNTGLQDACNLAWKLAMAARGHADDRLLDSYDAERVPVGEQLLNSTKKATRLVALKSAVQAVMLPVVFAVIRNVPALRGRIERKIMRQMTALSLTYPASPLTHEAPGARDPVPGARIAQVTPEEAAGAGWQALLAELRDPRWTLLVFDQPDEAGDTEAAGALAAEYESWLSVRTVADADSSPGPGPLADPGRRLAAGLGAGPGGWLLVRPDGYLSARGDRFTLQALRPALGAIGVPQRSTLT
ncbi:FAD-dependent oxidoreductase [Streptomyces iconiensis]|uniref:FAD-dependent oxidoreductase n=1 Tax=Streptomyces iconiensis TaxID=1384038 RepID=A0ABT7A6G5_9ACTN|nr:FAD-dependent oxidoreductase [Streptomyces iconiensis]MDJ1136896.1 FAD-dependent oxidoreductase [Streptomyces iconiensis]